jgi:hypothetical protein
VGHPADRDGQGALPAAGAALRLREDHHRGATVGAAGNVVYEPNVNAAAILLASEGNVPLERIGMLMASLLGTPVDRVRCPRPASKTGRGSGYRPVGGSSWASRQNTNPSGEAGH